MDQLNESDKTKEAFKVLERYCQKRYQQAQSFLSTNSENFSTHPILTPITTSRFSFQPELKTQHSFVSESGEESQKSPELPEFDRPDKYLINRQNIRSYLWQLTKFLYEKGLKHVLSILLVVVYTLFGGFMFYYLEAEGDQLYRAKIKQGIENKQEMTLFAIKHLLVNENCITVNMRNFTQLHISEFCGQRLEEIIQKLSLHVQANLNGGSLKDQWDWDYWNAIFFSLSIITTIGYGNMSCKTVKGRLATIFYGLFGIPLMLFLLNSIGHVMFTSVEVLWKQAKKKFKRKTRRVRKHILAGIKSNGKFYMSGDQTDLGCQLRQNTDATVLEETVEPEDSDIFETFPVYLALIIVFVYMFLCSIIMCFWESWDYFTAFYFFFISISTIGLGDELPEHPRYSICFFIFFIIGLSLGSMCVTIMQMRVENKYFKALELIDEQHKTMLENDGMTPQVIIEADDQRLSPEDAENPMLKASSRWKHPSALAINNDELMANLGFRGRGNSVSECLSPAEYYASPILSALINRRQGSQRNLMRQFSRSATNTTTANVSIDSGTPVQTPVKQYSADFLDNNFANGTKKLRPKHLWKDGGSFGTSINSIHAPLTIIVESKSDENVPPLAEPDTDSNSSQ